MIKYLSHKLVKTVVVVALAGLSGVADAQAPNWSQAGPIYNAGRSRNMVVDKNDPSGNTLYVGSSSSGVFTSTNGGVQWDAVPLQNNQLNVSYIAQAINGKIYVATGEGFLRPGQKTKALPGTGLYVINSGSLQLVPGAPSSTVGTVINRIACSPINANVIALATNVGIMTSMDGGNTFVLAPSPVMTGTNISGQDVKFDSNGILYCSIGCENSLSSVGSMVYKSTDNTLSSFNALNTLASTLLQDTTYGRIELAIAPSNNNIIYAVCANKYLTVASASLKGLFVSYDGGTSWGLILQGSAQLDPLTNGGTLASGDYASVITVNPFNPNQIYVGSYQFYTWTRTGGIDANPIGNWVKPSLTFNAYPQIYIAPNIHDIKLIKSGNSISFFYFITDAGIFRSSDGLASYQPFYKGLITGQFNSVSIERFPLSSGSAGQNGTQIIPYSGFIGGTGGNGLNYFSGAFPLATKEVNYGSGDVYESEFSKILPNAAYFTEGTGHLFRTTDVRSSDPTEVNLLASAKAQSILPFDNNLYNVTGTPFKMWENYGQVTSPDSVVFYNDTLTFAQSMQGIPQLTTQTTFTFSAARPNMNALIDSIVVRTGTVVLPINSSQYSPAFTGSDKKDITIALQHGYTAPSTGTIAPVIAGQTGPVVTSSTSVILNADNLLDNISVTFTAPPFQSKTTVSVTGVPDFAAYYRVFATVFYKYKVGDIVQVVDDKISTKTYSYTSVLTNSLSWEYGSSLPSFTLSASNASAVVNPTYVLTPGPGTPTNNATFTVAPVSATAYTITTSGTTTISAKPVTYIINAVPATGTAAVTSPSYVLTPGNTTQTAIAFIVTPTTTTNYTISEIGTGSITMGSTTFSTVNSSTYNLMPGNVNQSTPVFTISTPITYTILGLSSNTLIGANTSTTGTKAAVTTFSTLGYFQAGVAASNKPIKIATNLSARMAVAYGTAANVYISNAPLNLNNPISLINVSANKCLTTDAAGNKLSGPSNTVAVSGTVTAMEWSKSGTELYYATNDPPPLGTGNSFLYRVSYIDALVDSTSKNYSGKLHTNVFTYSNTVAPNGSKNNPRCPYRTTILGTYGKIITSISVTKDDKAIAVTFDNPTGTKVIYSTVPDIRKCDSTTVPMLFAPKEGTGLPASKIYCSLMEMSDNKRVFVGTDLGVYYTSDITAGSPIWMDGNNSQLPVIQVFDLKQQTMRPIECYNSGVILAATNGRGIWVNKDYQTPTFVGVKEETIAKKSNNLSIYPNPTNGTVFVSFNSVDGENASLVILDISGKVVQRESMGKLNGNQQLNFSLETNELSSGMYIVNITSDSGIKRVAKLVVTK